MTSRCCTVASNSSSAPPVAVPDCWGVGRSRGLAAAVGGNVVPWTAVAVGVPLSKHLPQEVLARTLAVMGMISVGFLLFTLITSNPFDRLFPVPADGRDLNPLLQDPGMATHPPTPYMGYVVLLRGLCVCHRRTDRRQLWMPAWARWTRPWRPRVAWSSLTIGIALAALQGPATSWVGGRWFRDPGRERLSHALVVGDRIRSIHWPSPRSATVSNRGRCCWPSFLPFVSSLGQPFLVRSGVLSSVHAFATDPRRGLFILSFSRW